MGIFGIIGKIIAFPFKLIFWSFGFIFGRGNKKETPTEMTATNYPPVTPPSQLPNYPAVVSEDNLKAKMDLMMSQVDSLKLEYEAANQRIQNIEKMVRELYTMAKS